MTKTYVHNGTEVRMTGRTAVRKTPAMTTVLYEIVPVTDFLASFSRWVPFHELYEVQSANGVS
jgi:hypothetical protein